MKAYLLTSKDFEHSFLQPIEPIKNWFSILEPGDIVYLDLDDVLIEHRAEVLKSLAKRCKTRSCLWGIWDAFNVLDDVADIFFNGASDYVCAKLGLKAIGPKRIAQIAKWRNFQPTSADQALAKAAGHSKKASRELAWDKIKKGQIVEVYLVYFSIFEGRELKRQMGDSHYNNLIERMARLIQKKLLPLDALLWMKGEGNLLFLVQSGHSRIEDFIEILLHLCLDMNIDSFEQLALSFALPLVCAIHRGSLPFAPTGQTGTLISEDVNYIYHFGEKGAEKNRITISSDASPLLSKEVQHLFAPAGPFEGKERWQSLCFLP